jgi:hypothetical protein
MPLEGHIAPGMNSASRPNINEKLAIINAELTVALLQRRA